MKQLKKRKKKKLLSVLLIVLLLTATVGGTVAYIVTSTSEKENVFIPGNVDTDITEEFTGSQKKSIAVRNNGNVPVYVRVMIVANWCDENGAIVAPWEGEIKLNSAAWVEGNDNYYYCKIPVAAGTSTANLLADTYLYSSSEVPVAGAHLEMTVIHQSIQAEPASVIQTEWGVTVADDGSISK